MNGFLIVNRRIAERSWYSDTNAFRVFFHLLISANYGETSDGVKLQRGQCVVSLRKLARTLSLTLKNVRSALRRLSKAGEITIEPSHRHTLVTINDYDGWQCMAAKRSDRKAAPEGFDEAWAAYGRKGSRKKAMEEWRRLSAEDRASVMPHIRAYVLSTEPRYMKNFERYLSDRAFTGVVSTDQGVTYDPERAGYQPLPSTAVWIDGRGWVYQMEYDGISTPIFDGYTDADRPDGATLGFRSFSYHIRWNSRQKHWDRC